MISHQKVPPMGWRYLEKRTNIELVAISWDRLVAHLKHHRKSNGLPEGEVEKDIEEQLSEKHPELVVK